MAEKQKDEKKQEASTSKSKSQKKRAPKSENPELKPLKLPPSQSQFLASRKIETLSDLLHTYPLRYTPIRPYDKWEEGDEVLFEGYVIRSTGGQRISHNRIVTQVTMYAWDQELVVSIFSYGYFPQIAIEKPLTVCGTFHKPNRISANWTSGAKVIEPGQLLYPNYSLPNKTRRDMMIKIIDKALKHVDALPDRIPQSLREKYRLLPLAKALKAVHQPQNEAELYQGVRALKYEEFLCFHCARLRQSIRIEKTPKQFDQSLIDQKIAALPYTLTPDQASSIDEILNDLRSDQAMYRLLQGEVGCGKTMVAAMALYACKLSGQQAALLAPTEILARQHVISLQKLGIEATLYCSSLKASEKKQVLKGLKEGTIDLVVGTHSLFQEAVEYDNLGLVVADEQHRFGVLQRRALIEKGHHVDVLLMSATPIPRTAAHFLYGDIDLSAIRTMPPGRKPVLTKYYQTSSMKPVLGRILEGIQKEGRQVYVVCPAIDENPDEGITAAKSIYEGMKSVLGRQISIDLLHGRMKTEEKEEIMDRFKRHETQILVSTTVIEVGIDVANATMMVIYDAHRFGLSALHQLRGRCARGPVQGECYLLSNSKTMQSVDRLKKMETLDNGFDLAAYDLQLRGPGDLLGTRQSGIPAFILGDAGKDLAMMDCCEKDAAEILEHPENPENRAMMAYLRQASDKSLVD